MSKSRKSTSKSSLKPQQQNKQNAPVASFTAIAHQGPLPMAAEFAAYERVLPGSANRIITMAEKSLDTEVFAIKSTKVGEMIALLTGRLFLYFLVLVAVYLLMKDKRIEAFLAGLAPIVSVIYGTFKRSSSKGSKDKTS